MNQRNCPNCGAPYKTELSTCPYCGTSYFDMSAIDINDCKPFYLKLKIGNMVFTSKVVVASDIQMNFQEDTRSFMGKFGEKIEEIVVNRYMDIDMRFRSIHDPDDVLCTMEVKDDVD
jgi:predicted  nucleic acid-binding Zn-ribbon protein